MYIYIYIYIYIYTYIYIYIYICKKRRNICLKVVVKVQHSRVKQNTSFLQEGVMHHMGSV